MVVFTWHTKIAVGWHDVVKKNVASHKIPVSILSMLRKEGILDLFFHLLNSYLSQDIELTKYESPQKHSFLEMKI